MNDTLTRARAYLAKVPSAAEGGRNAATFEVTCRLVELFDLPEADLATVLLEWNGSANTPPLPEREVRDCLRSAQQRTAYQGNGSKPASTTKLADPPAAPLPTEEELAEARAVLLDNWQAAVEARKYLSARGIDPEVCGWGLGKLRRGEAATFGLPAGAEGIRFLVPVYDPVSGQLCDVRRRYAACLGGEVPDAEKVLPWAKGYGSAKPYGWQDLPAGPELVWCEGETDREALAAAGFDAVSHTCGAGSAGKVARELPAELVTGRRFVFLFDHDQAGQDGAQRAAETLASRGAVVRVAQWPATLPGGRETPQGYDACDWFVDGFDAAALREILEAAEVVEPTRGEAGRPKVVVSDRYFDQKIDEARAAVEAANDPPDLFVRSGHLVEVIADEHDWPTIRSVNVNALRDRMARSARMVKLTREARGEGWRETPTDPPKEVVASALARPERWQVPPLEAVVQVPTLRPDGSLLLAPGYDPPTRLFYVPPKGLHVPPIPDQPTQQQATEALARVLCLFEQFPFVDREADRAAILALLLTPVIRPAVEGSVPLCLIDAPQQGTGKSLLAEVASIIATGQATFASAPHRGEEPEWRKLLTTLLAAGNTIIGFDNVEDVLKSAELAKAITAPTWQDRILGGNEQTRVPVRVTWIATGNNLRVGGDIARRCYRIRIDAKTAEPWERKGFNIPNLRGYALDRRGELLANLLTIARAWYVTGQPEAPGLPQLGGFEEWRRIVGGMVAFAGMTGFLSNLHELYEEADPDAAAWRSFLEAWRAFYGDQPVTTKQLADVIDEANKGTGQQAVYEEDQSPRVTLAETVPGFLLSSDGRVNRRSMGKQLDKVAGRRYPPENIRVERAGRDAAAKVVRWQVVSDAPESKPRNENQPAERVGGGPAGSAGFSQVNARDNEKDRESDAYGGGMAETPETRHHPNKAALQTDLDSGVSEPGIADNDEDCLHSWDG